MKSDKTTNIKKVFRLKDITLSLSILGAGALLTLFVPSWGWLGYFLLFTGICMLPFHKTGYRLKGESGIFLKKEFILPHECLGDIAAYMEGKTDTLDIDPFMKGGLIMELYYKKSNLEMFGQLFDYYSGKYTEQSSLSKVSPEKLNCLLKYQS